MQGGTTIDQARSSGFTIIEVMLFLAISGILFAASLSELGHKQSTTEFDVGLNTFVSQLQTTINNVADGNYNLPQGMDCTTNGDAPDPGSGNSTTPDCVFLGSVLLFGNTDPSASAEQIYYTIPVIANRYQNGVGPQEAYTLAGAHPTTTPSLAQSTVMPNGLDVEGIYYQTSSTGTQYAVSSFGWLTSLGSYTGSAAGSQTLQAGAQNLSLVPIPPGPNTPPLSETTAINNINTLTDSCPLAIIPDTICLGGETSPEYSTNASLENPPSGVVMCVGNGSESAQLTIGGESSTTNVAVQRFNSSNCT